MIQEVNCTEGVRAPAGCCETSRTTRCRDRRELSSERLSNETNSTFSPTVPTHDRMQQGRKLAAKECAQVSSLSAPAEVKQVHVARTT